MSTILNLEAQRLENLRQKQKLLADLNLHSYTSSTRSTNRKADGDDYDDEDENENEALTPRPKKKRKVDVAGRKRRVADIPSRTSARLASSTTRPSYKEDGGDKWQYVDRDVTSKKNIRSTKRNGGLSDKMIDGLDNGDIDVLGDTRSLVPVADVDDIRAGWTDWKAVAGPPTRDEEGTFHFEGEFENFTPNKSPEEMIREGAFGGSYFRPLKSRKLGIVVQDDWKELDQDWVRGLDVERYLTSPVYDADVNKFKVACGQSIEEWEAAGWIVHEFDVRGWFQWYCRFWMGRRCEDDDRQVGRWAKCVGPRGRWRRLLLKKYVNMGVRDVFDDGDEVDEEGESKQVSPVMHQTCHHWAFEVRQGDLDEAWKEFR